MRAEAWRALAAALHLLPPELRRQRVLPLLLRLCRGPRPEPEPFSQPPPHPEVQRGLAEGFGVLLGRLVADMDGEAEVTACLGAFRGLSGSPDRETRAACAAAFAGVLRAATARRYATHLHDTLLRLAGDADGSVRLALAVALPEVAASLGGRERCCQYLRQPLAALVQDGWHDVQAALLARLPELLGHFGAAAAPGGSSASGSSAAAATTATASEEQRGKSLVGLLEPLVRLEAGSGRNWRLQLALLQAMPALPPYFPADPLNDRLLPLALKYLAGGGQAGAAAVRGAAADATAALWRAQRKASHRTALYGKIIHDFAQVRTVGWGWWGGGVGGMRV